MGNNVELNNTIRAMQTYADRQGNGNGNVDTAEEIIIFEKLADKKYENGELDDASYTQALGLYKNNATNPVTTETKVETGTKEKTVRSSSDVSEVFKSKIEAAISQKDFRQEAIVNELTKEIEKIADKKDRKAAEKVLENLVLQNAQAYVEEAISSVEYTSRDKEGAIQDVAIKYLKEHNMWDKYTEKEISRRNLFKQDSFGEALIEKQQIKNRVSLKQNQTYTDIKKKLNKGKNDIGLLQNLVDAGLVKAGETSLYDLTDLSNTILKFVGKDYTLSYADKETKNHSELVNLKAELNRILKEQGVDKELSKREVKILVELCGFDIQGPDIGKIAKGTLIGGVVNAIAGGVAAVTNPKQDVLIEGDTFINNTKVELKGDFLGDINFGELPEGFETIKTSTGVVVTIKQLIETPDILVKISKNIAGTALKTALFGAAAGALASMKPDGEISVESPVTLDTYENYVGRLAQKKENPYAPIFILLASAFLKDGEWDRDGYNQFLQELGGQEGIINKRELHGELQRLQRELKTVDPGDNCEDPETCTANIKPDKTPDTTEAQDATYIHKRKGGDTWKGIVEAYYPGLIENCGGLWGKNGAIKALQRELCIDDNGNFDKAKFNDLVTATDIPKEMKMPLHVNGIQRQINGVKAADFQKAEGKDIKKSLDKVGRDEKVYITKVGAGLYVATDDCDSSQKATGKTKAEALTNLKAKTQKTYSNEEELLK